MNKLKAIAAILAAFYVICWLLSFGVVYSFHTEHTFRQVDDVSIQGVDIGVWGNPITNVWKQSWICPLIVRGESSGPYTIGVRLDDSEMTAKQYRIDLAELKNHDGSILPLTLADHRSGTHEKAWHPFFKNASAWIGHVYHAGELALDGPFTLTLDITIEKDGQQVQKKVDIKMLPFVKRRNGLSMAT